MKYLIPTAGLFGMIGFVLAQLPNSMMYPYVSIAMLILLAIPVYYQYIKEYGALGVYAVAVLMLFALSIETIGLYTGFPYSDFRYVLPLGTQLFGTTPWTVMIAWPPLVLGVYALTQSWFNRYGSQFLVFVGLLVSVDAVLDPGAVARGLWEFIHGGFWYGVPLQNFIGWAFSGAIAFLILALILRESKNHQASRWSLMVMNIAVIANLAIWTGAAFSNVQVGPIIIGLALLSILTYGLVGTGQTHAKQEIDH